MNKAELRAYVIAHPDDKEAFYALTDLLTANPSSIKYPAQMTPEEIKLFQNGLKKNEIIQISNEELANGL